jgi:hypothetical protein
VLTPGSEVIVLIFPEEAIVAVSEITGKDRDFFITAVRRGVSTTDDTVASCFCVFPVIGFSEGRVTGFLFLSNGLWLPLMSC